MIQYADGPISYQPGVCNIGPAESRRRRQIGYLGVAAAVVLGLFLLAVDAPAAARLLIALPLAGGLDGLIQARLKFCAGYGLAGLRNMGELGQAERVEDAAARAVDRRRALIIHATAAVAGLAVAVLFTLLPL
jgi:uncharacterized membrane protein